MPSFVNHAAAAPAQAINDKVFINVKTRRSRFQLTGLETRQQALADQVIRQLFFIVANEGARGRELLCIEQARFDQLVCETRLHRALVRNDNAFRGASENSGETK
jgi:hypothetical protein